MTKEELSYNLEKRLHKMFPLIETQRTPVKYQGEERISDWSLQFKIPKGETQCDYIKRVFGIDCSDWKDKYNEAVSGNGKEDSKVIALHSSSLLSLLCFSNISLTQPLEIEGKIYNKVHFEVKNRVFDNPSNIDVVLENNQTGDLLFLESKFSEYLNPSNNAFAKKYFEFYTEILPMIEHYPLQIVYPRKYKDEVGMGLKAASKSKLYSHLYMDGIKQCFSHLIGICQGPDENEVFQWGGFKGNIRFGTIIYRFPGDSFKSYKSFYSNSVGKIDSNKLNRAINHLQGIDNRFANRIEILPEILTYQDVFNGFNLPRNIKIYYNL